MITPFSDQYRLAIVLIELDSFSICERKIFPYIISRKYAASKGLKLVTGVNVNTRGCYLENIVLSHLICTTLYVCIEYYSIVITFQACHHYGPRHTHKQPYSDFILKLHRLVFGNPDVQSVSHAQESMSPIEDSDGKKMKWIFY